MKTLLCMFMSGLLTVVVSGAQLSAEQQTLIRHANRLNPEAMLRCADDWETTWSPSADSEALKALAKAVPDRRKQAIAALQQQGDASQVKALLRDVRQAMVKLPLLKDLEIMAVRNKFGNARNQGAPSQPGLACYNMADSNKNIDSRLVRITGFDKEQPQVKEFFKPNGNATVACTDLNFDGKRVLFISKGPNNRWHLWEVGTDGKNLKRLSPDDINYEIADCCYLPDGKVIISSTAPEQGLPCESGRLAMTNLFRYDPKTRKMERLTFDQDSNWSPTVMDDGRVMYVRWEYCDLSHFFSRIVMTMRPDGTRQLGYFGSNGFWPNHYGDPIPIPGANGKFICVATGHHAQKPGRLALFDVSKGRAEAAGCEQMLPGWKKPIPERVEDYLYAGDWPKFLQPYPLGTSPKKDGAGKYFLASMRGSDKDLWGIYLVDVFDNMTLLYEEEGSAMNEPIRYGTRKVPPVYPDNVRPGEKTCTMHVADIYQGPGLRGVPRGTVKSARLFAYHYAYMKAGSHEGVGTESSWDMKYVLGTVPVGEDGSVYFVAPAHTPIAIQPLDANGSAIQLMRSWMVGMPGEHVACIGCHESPNSIYNVPVLQGSPVAIKPLDGKRVRAWSFMRDIQPILQRRCVGCHNSDEGNTVVDTRKPNFADIAPMTIKYPLQYNKGISDSGAGAFTRSYHELNPYVRRPGPESDNHLFNPYEYNANTSPLVQLLRRGHYGVELTPDEWQMLYTWIDLNVPFWGTWLDFAKYWSNESHRNWIGIKGNDQQVKRVTESRNNRIKWAKQYQCLDATIDPELDGYSFEDCKRDMAKIKFEPPKRRVEASAVTPTVKDWPMASVAMPEQKIFKLPGGDLAFRKIPTGSFVMGDAAGYVDEQPCAVTIDKSFYMAEVELPNANFSAFQPAHYSGYIDILGKDHTSPGIDAMKPQMPAIRISWTDAQAYCAWLSQKLGKKVRLPTEAEWEWAARAGKDSAFYWGDVDSDFSSYANLADAALENLPNQRQTLNYYLREMKYNDKDMVIGTVGTHKPNAFGLKDMIGNVAEWTQSSYRPYPYVASDGRNDVSQEDRVTRGGSWDVLPRFARVSLRTPYHPWQPVANVGIRLVIED